MTDADSSNAQPLLRVVRGQPTDEELAALVAVLASRAVTSSQPSRVRSAWGDPAHSVRRTLAPGPDAWRRSQRLP